jgi:hypothetical protein
MAEILIVFIYSNTKSTPYPLFGKNRGVAQKSIYPYLSTQNRRHTFFVFFRGGVAQNAPFSAIHTPVALLEMI